MFTEKDTVASVAAVAWVVSGSPSVVGSVAETGCGTVFSLGAVGELVLTGGMSLGSWGNVFVCGGTVYLGVGGMELPQPGCAVGPCGTCGNDGGAVMGGGGGLLPGKAYDDGSVLMGGLSGWGWDSQLAGLCMGRQPVPWGSLKGMGSARTKMGDVCGASYVGAWGLPVPSPQGGKEPPGTNTTGDGAVPPWSTP